MSNEMVTTVMDFAETVKMLEQIKLNVEELQKNTTNSLIVHEGKVLVLVERKAREGDFVVFEGLTSADTVNGKPYRVIDYYGSPYYVGELGGHPYNVYGWEYNCPNPKIYEVIGNLPQSDEVVFEPLPIENGTKIPCNHLTANQKRARAIQMAKDFAEKAIEDARDSDGDITVPDSGGHKYPWCCSKIRFKINTKKRTVVALAIGAGDATVVERAIAKCHPDDVFNEHIGRAVALAKALDIVEQLPPDILKAVQPDKFVKGMKVIWLDDFGGKNERIIESVDGIKVHFTNSYWMSKDEVTIIDDTNANYLLQGGEK